MALEKLSVNRLIGKDIFDPVGDRVGKVKDFLVVQRKDLAPLIVGIVAGIAGSRSVFINIARVTSITQNQIIISGKVNITKFQKRSGEELISADLRGSRTSSDAGEGTIEDSFIEKDRLGEWELTEVLLKLQRKDGLFGRAVTVTIPWEQLHQSKGAQANPMKQLVVSWSELLPADLANELLSLDRKELIDAVAELPEGRLASALEEMAESDQVVILSRLADDRAARILTEMDPDDAADLIAELPEAKGEQLLDLMEPDEADDLRMLLSYDSKTAGGLMTSEPIILSASTTVAEGLAHIRADHISSTLATMVCITLPPFDTPTGRYLGVVTFQRMLRYPPGERLGTLIESSIEPVLDSTPADEVSRILASYDLLALPVINEQRRLVGLVTVDDVLDFLMPSDWREAGVAAAKLARSETGQITIPRSSE